jgi:hypothetical protein
MSRLEIAVKMAAVFRDKFDFSKEEDFTAWANLALKAADTIIAAEKASRKEDK